MTGAAYLRMQLGEGGEGIVTIHGDGGPSVLIVLRAFESDPAKLTPLLAGEGWRLALPLLTSQGVWVQRLEQLAVEPRLRLVSAEGTQFKPID